MNQTTQLHTHLLPYFTHVAWFIYANRAGADVSA